RDPQPCASRRDRRGPDALDEHIICEQALRDVHRGGGVADEHRYDMPGRIWAWRRTEIQSQSGETLSHGPCAVGALWPAMRLGGDDIDRRTRRRDHGWWQRRGVDEAARRVNQQLDNRPPRHHERAERSERLAQRPHLYGDTILQTVGGYDARTV